MAFASLEADLEHRDQPSTVVQWKRVGLITQRSPDRTHKLLYFYFLRTHLKMVSIYNIYNRYEKFTK